jgi:hypothetical protein
MYADIEAKIITRLRDKLGGAVTVEPLREVERVPELRQRAPAAWVIYDGYRPGESMPSIPGVQQIVMEWFVVVAAKSARGNGEVDDARDMAGELSTKVVEALLGYDVGGGKRLRLAEAPGPEYDAGYCHLPLAFTCAATFKGTP